MENADHLDFKFELMEIYTHMLKHAASTCKLFLLHVLLHKAIDRSAQDIFLVLF